MINGDRERIITLVEGIRGYIAQYRAGGLPIHRLSSDLKAATAALEEVADPRWVDELRTMRNQVEYVNACYIDSGRRELNEEERRDVGEILSEMEAMLVEY